MDERMNRRVANVECWRLLKERERLKVRESLMRKASSGFKCEKYEEKKASH